MSFDGTVLKLDQVVDEVVVQKMVPYNAIRVQDNDGTLFGEAW